MGRSTMLKMFDLLGSVEVTAPDGLGFCISLSKFDGDEKKLLKAIPTPDYEHRIYKDEATGDYLVMRPGPGHKYVAWNGLKRYR